MYETVGTKSFKNVFNFNLIDYFKSIEQSLVIVLVDQCS